MKWILICFALATNPVDGSRDLYLFKQLFDSVENCKTYSMVNAQEIQEIVVQEIGPFAAFCVTEEVFQRDIAPSLNPEEQKKKGLDA